MNAVMLACCGTDNVDMLQLLVGEYKMDPNAKDLVRADMGYTPGFLLMWCTVTTVDACSVQ